MNEALTVIATGMSAIAALAALAVAYLSLRQSQRATEAAQRQAARAMDDALQSRLDPMYPGLRQLLGHLEDGVPHDVRQVLIPFFVLYSDAYGAYRDGLVDYRDWEGFEKELAYWSQKPIARFAWSSFRNQVWTDGFVDYVDRILAGAPPYPNLQEGIAVPTLEDWLEMLRVATSEVEGEVHLQGNDSVS